MNFIKRFAKGRRRAGGRMNGTEQSYANHLELLKRAGEVIDFWFEPFSMQLAKGCFYRPDFLVLMKTFELEIHEIKGHWEDDALVKIKIAAEKFPFKFMAIKKLKSGWDQREVGVHNLTAKEKK